MRLLCHRLNVDLGFRLFLRSPVSQAASASGEACVSGVSLVCLWDIPGGACRRVCGQFVIEERCLSRPRIHSLPRCAVRSRARSVHCTACLYPPWTQPLPLQSL